ncbi:hypothetical protein BJ138DRAFT_1133505 [Hygrophoropsis aurantiaca]|uniref:Uncharacterized protein n=1 Tax=Hygrophoropsis aurantiaca TaxID=72124 RepID=A0ACB8AM02_9AGAM|nr:hypothetical protein BJ138DRAFT_1133505 [Hygrophoropsis aurantiaca]
MNSPEPGSPISTDSSGSPPPDDFQFTQMAHDQQQPIHNPAASMFHSGSSIVPSPISSKRRLPGGSTFDSSSSRRDAKSRRREDAMGIVGGSRRLAGDGPNVVMGGSNYGPPSGGPSWAKGDFSGRRDKDELVDGPLVDQLRKEFGDPFLESVVKTHS